MSVGPVSSGGTGPAHGCGHGGPRSSWWRNTRGLEAVRAGAARSAVQGPTRRGEATGLMASEVKVEHYMHPWRQVARPSNPGCGRERSMRHRQTRMSRLGGNGGSSTESPDGLCAWHQEDWKIAPRVTRRSLHRPLLQAAICWSCTRGARHASRWCP
jgi:hypothetical protein